MRSKSLAVGFALLVAAFVGCGKSAGTSAPDSASTQPAAAENTVAEQSAPASASAPGCPAPPANLDSPEGAVYQFLAAMRAGDDASTEAMFSDIARQQIKQHKINVAPPRCDTASFEVGKVKYLDDEVEGQKVGAWVESAWSDINPETKTRQTENVIWVVRKEAIGWRIAGMATRAVPGADPVEINFEKLDEAQKKLEKLQETALQEQQGLNGEAAEQSDPSQSPSSRTPPEKEIMATSQQDKAPADSPQVAEKKSSDSTKQ